MVCAGAKAVLDLPRTMERLETLGVPVFGWGTDELPAFYRCRSGLPVDARFDAMPQLARAVRTHWELGLGTGIVIGNPIREADEIPESIYAPALERALAEAAEQRLRGRAVTPFLLERLRELSQGRSLTANIAMLRNNACVAAELSRALEDGAGS